MRRIERFAKLMIRLTGNFTFQLNSPEVYEKMDTPRRQFLEMSREKNTRDMPEGIVHSPMRLILGLAAK